MSAWAEIRRLQAALDEVQSTITSHKLSERNCIEVVSKLQEMGLISVLYTMDGKEYVLTSYLETEIIREMEAHRGRINTVDLQEILNVDLAHIQKAVNSITSKDPSLELIQGELISSQYKETLCAQVNEMLLQTGHVSLADLSTTMGLPLSYIIPCIESSLGVLIKGQLDKSGSGLLYTDLYVSRHRSKMRGTFSAVTRPTPVGPILQRGNYNENLFHSILHELVNGGQLPGTVHGRSDKAIYIPFVYTEMQNHWVDDFLAANGYLEYEVVGRLGISEPLKYIKQRYKSHDLLMLNTCCLATRVIEEIEGCVQEEVRRTEKWVDILPLLPTPCTTVDANVLLSGNYGNDPSLMVFGSVVSHVKFIRNCQELFTSLLTERAQKAALTSGSFLRQVSKDGGVSEGEGGGKKGGKQRKGGKSTGGGRRGKEKEVDDGSSHWEIKFMSIEEISSVLVEKLDDVGEEFATELAQVLSRPLQQLFQEKAKQLLAEQAEGDAGKLRKKHSQLSSQVQELWNRARLFEKGALKFEGETRTLLLKYLLKTLCTDMTNIVVEYIATDNGCQVPEDTPTLNKERLKIIKKFPEPVKQLAIDVNGCLSKKDTDEFFIEFEKLCSSDSCGLMIKKLDKKKEKLLVHTHQQSLIDSLKQETDPTMTLHLTVVILFQQLNTACLLHTPGRLLPAIIPQLRDGLAPEDYRLLTKLQDLVILQLKTLQTSLLTASSTSVTSEDTPPDTDKLSDSKRGTLSPTVTTPSPVATTPSPVEGEWEMVKSEQQPELVVSETSLKLLEEVLVEEKKDAPLPEETTPPIEKRGSDIKTASEDISVPSDVGVAEGGPQGEKGQEDVSSQLDSIIQSVKDLVFRKKIKKL